MIGSIWGLVIALLFPLAFSLHGLIIQNQKSFTSIIAFFGILLTGTIGLMKFPPHWVAVKEAAIPLIIGIVILFSTKTSWQVVTKMFFNHEIFDIDKVRNRLNSNDLQIQLCRKLNKANIFLSFSFFISAGLNFFLARIVESTPGTTQFNEELGRKAMLSFPVIVFPSVLIMIFIYWYIMSSIKQLTQLNSNEILSGRFRT